MSDDFEPHPQTGQPIGVQLPIRRRRRVPVP